MTEIILHAEPGVVMDWEDFQEKKPPFSIALDGYVAGQTKFSPLGTFANFNHHEGVDRLATRRRYKQSINRKDSGSIKQRTVLLDNDKHV